MWGVIDSPAMLTGLALAVVCVAACWLGGERVRRWIIGRVLVLVGLALGTVCGLASTGFPIVPVGALFIAAALLAGVLPMMIGFRMMARADHPERSAAEFEYEYQRETFRFAVTLGVSLALAAVLVAPMAVMAGGLVPWNKGFLIAWAAVWCAVVRLGCRPLLRPLHRAADRVALGWYDRRHPGPGSAPDPAGASASPDRGRPRPPGR